MLRFFQSEARKVLIDNRETNVAFFYWEDDGNVWLEIDFWPFVAKGEICTFACFN